MSFFEDVQALKTKLITAGYVKPGKALQTAMDIAQECGPELFQVVEVPAALAVTNHPPDQQEAAKQVVKVELLAQILIALAQKHP